MAKKPTASTVLLFSGGLDSFVLAHKFAADGRPFRALYLDFGKLVSPREISTVKRLSLDLNFCLDIVELSGLHALQLGYIPDTHLIAEQDVADPLPDHDKSPRTSGYQVVLGVGSYFAQITKNSSVTLGLVKEQFQRYTKLGEALVNHAAVVEALNPHLGKFSVEVPLSSLKKSEVIAAGVAAGVRLENSWSCLLGDERQCGRCVQCQSRKAAFKSSRVNDTTAYQE